MAAKKLAIAFCTFAFLQTSFAGFERFWFFSKSANDQVTDSWETLSDAEQAALVKRYQSIKELPEAQSHTLLQRVDWFAQLSDQEKQKIRDIWQRMSSQERRELAQRLQAAKPENRAEIREEYIQKYALKPALVSN